MYFILVIDQICFGKVCSWDKPFCRRCLAKSVVTGAPQSRYLGAGDGGHPHARRAAVKGILVFYQMQRNNHHRMPVFYVSVEC